MRRWDALAEGYLSCCRTRGLSSETIESRRRELDRWGCWLKRRRPRPGLEAVDSQTMILYVRSRAAFRSRGTLAGVISVMRGMGEYLVQEGVWRRNPFRWIRGPKLDGRSRLPRRIGRRDLEKLWETAASSRGEYRRHLWVAVLSVLYGTGLRRGELERLSVSDWDGGQSLLRVDGRKTGRERAVPVSEVVARCIEAYLPHRQNRLEAAFRLEEEALFVGASGERMLGGQLSRGIHRLARKAGVPLSSLHQFRHTCASDLLESGIRLPEIQQIMGHAAITSTMRYLDVADPERRRAVERHPINGMLGHGTGGGARREA